MLATGLCDYHMVIIDKYNKNVEDSLQDSASQVITPSM